MSNSKEIFATPKVRKFARELGANIEKVVGSARDGRITEEDVKKFVNSSLSNKKADQNNDRRFNQLEYSHEEFGKVEQLPQLESKKMIMLMSPKKSK